MAATQTPVTGLADRVLVSGTTPLSPGRLKGVTIDIQATGSNPAQNFVRVFLEQQDIEVPTYRHLLVQGYIGFRSAITWTGDLPIGPNDQLTTELMSSTLASAITSITTEPN